MPRALLGAGEEGANMSMLDPQISNCSLLEGLRTVRVSDFSSLPFTTRMMYTIWSVNLGYQKFLQLLPRCAELENYQIISYVVPFTCFPQRSHISSSNASEDKDLLTLWDVHPTIIWWWQSSILSSRWITLLFASFMQSCVCLLKTVGSHPKGRLVAFFSAGTKEMFLFFF